ncbi:MAG: hypothetical protein K2R93_17715 [Gemmatimonadaceae bacterium]|nr:hypothetical protein [Gemmatimonadaceae bacterium]
MHQPRWSRTTRLLLAIATGAAHAASPSPASAQSPAMTPFELNMERVSSKKFGGDLGDSKTYFVPTYDLLVSVSGSVWSKKGGAQAHGRFFVDGLDKPLMHAIARKLQDDLVARIRAAGFTALTYDDLKGEPDVAGRGLDADEDKWGFPVRKITPLSYIIAAPSEAQQFNNPIQGPAWPWKGLAKAKDLVVLSPELRFTLPQMWGVTRAGVTANEAGIATDPAMILEAGTIHSIGRKGGGETVQIDRHGQRLAAESAGTITQLKQDRTDFSAAWKRVSGDYSMSIDRTAFEDGVMRVGLAINAMLVDKLVKAHK